MNEFKSREWQPSIRTWRTVRDTCLRITLRFEGEMADELFETRATLTRPRLALQWWRILATTTSTLLTTPTDRLTDNPTPAEIKRGTKIPRFDPVSEKKEQDFDVWSFFLGNFRQTKIYYGLLCYGFRFIILVLFCYFTIFLYYGNYMYIVYRIWMLCKNRIYTAKCI